MSLFDIPERENRRSALPLAARMRPANLDEFLGQEHFLGEGKLLRRLLKADRLGSVIFSGPPGTGKTTLAYLLAKASRCTFKQLSAVSDGVKQLREILAEAMNRLSVSRQRTLLFIDEIHRFNKSQQDVLLPEVEQGVVTLVGATTENPFFSINNALLSRSRVFQFEPLSPEHIKMLLRRAASDRDRGLGRYPVHLHEDALDYIAEICEGDARQALATLEIAVLSSLDMQSNAKTIPKPISCKCDLTEKNTVNTNCSDKKIVDDSVANSVEKGIRNPTENSAGNPIEKSDEKFDELLEKTNNTKTIDRTETAKKTEGIEGTGKSEKKKNIENAVIELTKELAVESVQRKMVRYDRDGDDHYDVISALIKSIRGSDPDAAVYWLARMLEGGENVRFLARRLVILASEDVGNADPAALPLAVAAAQACELVGLPECQLNLAQTVTYLATAPKSNASTLAIFEAKKDIQTGATVPVPRHLRDAHYKGSEQFGHIGYQYAHNAKDAIAAQDYLGVDREYYRPVDRGFESELQRRLVKIRSVLRQAKPESDPVKPKQSKLE